MRSIFAEAHDVVAAFWGEPFPEQVNVTIADYIDKIYGRNVLYDLMSVTTEVVFLDKLGVSEQQLLDAWRVWVIED